MKTLKQILKELLKGKKLKAAIPPEPVEQPLSDNQPQINNPKKRDDEAEDHESAGDHHLAGAGGEKVDGAVQGSDRTRNDPAGKSDGGAVGTGGANGAAVEPDEAPESEGCRNPHADIDFESAVEEAYNRGVIDGRNSRIREQYFPNTDDGVPHFRGNPARTAGGSDIFTMAREA